MKITYYLLLWKRAFVNDLETGTKMNIIVLLFNKSFFFLVVETNGMDLIEWKKSLPFSDILIILTIGSFVCIVKWWNVL